MMHVPHVLQCDTVRLVRTTHTWWHVASNVEHTYVLIVQRTFYILYRTSVPMED